MATVRTVVAQLLIPAMNAFRATGQTARIRLLDSAANEVAEAVAAGEADFGICSIPMLEPTTRFELLFNDPIVLALPLDHALARREVLDLSDLEETPLILPARGTGNRLLIDEAMARVKRPLYWTYEVGRSSTAMELVREGVSAALLSKFAVDATQVAICQLQTPVSPARLAC
ncbi:hypothetical protein EBB79_11495 [Parasedimentitalea marina]|uniref:LysR substrate-binding domain-containing protein n=1 Tax=Parasedimentitalea marina TaxID=2483033 RepID=A0A3T0N386_9RHOB|nr:LysR substrate-binding domain-containing protein [Parasedimentitalea marina]AZV78442.1 hypothetical protein EBB79_11495 [Parasedimentitalea marina]